MLAITSKIVQFSPVDNNGIINGEYYLNQNGEVVSIPKDTNVTRTTLPYAANVELDKTDDILTIHASEVEALISRLQSKVSTMPDGPDKQKYLGYIEALQFIVSYNSYVNPWKDYILSIEEEFDYGWL